MADEKPSASEQHICFLKTVTIVGCNEDNVVFSEKLEAVI